MENKEQDRFDSGRGSSSNPIQLPEVIVYGKRPLPWYKRTLNGVAKFVNDEIFLNKDNIRVKNAQRHPRAMDTVQEGGNIAGAIIAAPIAAYAAAQAAPVVLPALKVAGQAMTPSTWIGGGMQAAGYQAPTWLLNGADLAASAYYANEAGKDIDKNGLTWKTGFNALMSLAPMTRETEAIEGVANTLRRPTQAVSSVVDDFRAARNAASSPEAVLGREFSRSVKNTKLVNVPVEHVSPNGMTKGSALDVGEEGIHLSPAGSTTTTNIQRITRYPFVRIGTWTYSNNTRPMEVQDIGYFGRGFNQDFDSKVSNGITNFKYTNNFEGNGNQSFLTTEPSFGLQLSKNTQNSKIDWNTPAVKTSEGLRLVDGTMTPDLRGTLYNYLGLPSKSFHYTDIKNHPEWGKFSVQKYSQNGRDYYIGENSDRSKVIYSLPGESDFHMIGPSSKQDYWRIRNEIEDAILTSRHNFIESLPDNEIKSLVRSSNINSVRGASAAKVNSPESRLTDMLRSKVKSDIEDVYLSDEYIDRYMQSLGLNPKSQDLRQQVKSIIANDVYSTYDISTPKIYVDQPFNGGSSTTLFKNAPGSSGPFSLKKTPAEHVYGINTNTGPEYLENDWTSILFHEFGHNLWSDTTPFSKYLRNYNRRQIYDNFTPLDLTETAFKQENKDFVKYLRDPNEFRQRVMEGVRYGIKEGLTPEEIYNECQTTGFAALKPYFRREYLVKMLGLMLGTTPLIVNTNNDKSS